MSIDFSEPWVLDLYEGDDNKPHKVEVKVNCNNTCPIVLWTANVCY